MNIFAVYQHFSRKFSVRDIRNNATYNVQKRAFPFARMPGNKIHFAVRKREIYVSENLRFSVVGKINVFKFYRVHNTTVQTAPAAIPKINSTSDMHTVSFLYTVYGVFSSENPRVSTESDNVSEMFTSRITSGTRKAL